MRIEKHGSKWGDAAHFGVYVEWQDWCIWRHSFDVGFSFGPWDFALTIILWDVEETIQMLKDHGKTDKEAWEFCNGVRMNLPDPYSKRVNMQKEIEKELVRR